MLTVVAPQKLGGKMMSTSSAKIEDEVGAAAPADAVMNKKIAELFERAAVAFVG